MYPRLLWELVRHKKVNNIEIISKNNNLDYFICE